MCIRDRNSYGACAILRLFNLSCPFAIMSLIGCDNYEGRNNTFSTSLVVCEQPFTKEDKILIKNLFELKGYNARHLVREFPRKS